VLVPKLAQARGAQQEVSGGAGLESEPTQRVSDPARPLVEAAVGHRRLLEPQIAADDALTPQARFMAEAGYMSMHLTPARAAQSRAYAEKLGYRSLGAGLRPIDVT
jgi:hypothetical protein